MISALLCIICLLQAFSFEEGIACLSQKLWGSLGQKHSDGGALKDGNHVFFLWPLAQFITLSQRFNYNRRGLGKEEKEGGRGRHYD